MRADKKMSGVEKFMSRAGSVTAKKDFEALAKGDQKKVSTAKLKDKLEDHLKGLHGKDKKAFKEELNNAFEAFASGKTIKVKDAQALYRSVKRRVQSAQAFGGNLNGKLDSSQVRHKLMDVLRDRKYMKDFDPKDKKFQKQLDMVLDKVKGKDLTYSEFHQTLAGAKRAANDVFELGSDKKMDKKKMEKMK